MKTQVHFRGIHPVDDAETRRYAEELAGRLDRIIEFYRDEQKRLRLVVEGHRQGYRAGGSITVPNKALYAEGEGATLTEALEQVFERLRKELTRHRATVRKEYVKKRRSDWAADLKAAREALVREARDKKKEGFSERFLPLLRGLYRTARRRIVLHQLAGELEPGELRPAEVIDELVSWEYENFHESAPDADMSVILQQHLRDRIETVIAGTERTVDVPPDGPELDDPRFRVAEDEEQIFYDNPERLRWGDILENGDSAGTDDSDTQNQTALIYRTLSKLDRAEREAYVLHVIEGWEPADVARITHMPESDVTDSITQSARFVKHQLNIP